MLYLDDLKLFAKSRSELESLLNTVRLFSDSICMSFGLSKCASASIIRGKLSGSTNVTLSEDVIIPALGALDSYKYLGLLEHDIIKDSQIKTIIVKQYRQRTK